MLYLDLKYLHFFSPKLEGFVKKKDNVWNFRCNRCGDSATDKRKKRAFIFAWKNGLVFHCHNCGESHSFQKYLKLCDPYLYEQYRVELFTEKYGSKSYAQPTPAPSPAPQPKPCTLSVEETFYSICKPLSSLSDDNPAVKYCLSRKIPRFQFSRIYFIDDTKKLLQLNPELDIKFSEQRLVLPFFDKSGHLIGMTCRALGKSKLRYLTVKLSECTQIFGMDKVDPTKTIYVVEGPIDSLFLPNAIAVTGTSFGKVDTILSELNIAPDQVVVIVDNQPRNKEVVKVVDRVISKGLTVVIWDTDESYGKDINSMITDGNIPVTEVFKTIRRCTTRGLEARMKFIHWKKINIGKESV